MCICFLVPFCSFLFFYFLILAFVSFFASYFCALSFPTFHSLLFTPRHSQSLLMEGFTALSAFLATFNASAKRNALWLRLQDVMLIEMALPSHIYAGRFSCETKKAQKNM